jgi:hypothetical protein
VNARAKHVFVEVVAATVASVGGFGAFLLVFAWPNLTSRPELMLAWGWIGWIPGLFVGYYVGALLRAAARRVLRATGA